MNTPMHFRKRQLLAYQLEVNSTQQTLVNEPPSYPYTNEFQSPFDYPPSPSSIASEKSTTPTTLCDSNVATIQWINEHNSNHQIEVNLSKNTVALPDTKNVPPPSSRDARKLAQISEALTDLEKPVNGKKLAHDQPTLIQIANELKESIQEYINQQTTNTAATKSSLSTLVLAKLNQLKANAPPLQPYIKQCPDEVSYDSHPTYSTPEPELLPEDLSMKKIKQEHQSNYEEEDMDLGESKLVIVEPDFPMHIEHDDFHGNGMSKYKSRHSFSRQGLHYLTSRISGILSFINRTQARMEEFKRRGINVYEKVTNTARKSKKKKSSKSLEKVKKSSSSSSLAQINNNPLRPAGVHIYKRLPWTNGLRSSLEKKPPPVFPIPSPFDPSLVIIGPNGTTIPREAWIKVDWELSPPSVTRKLLMILFDREFLSTHSLTGRPSPAFLELNKPEKKPMDTRIVADLVELVTSRTIATPKEVRMAITTKCADECKMRRSREARQISIDEKENWRMRMRPY